MAEFTEKGGLYVPEEKDTTAERRQVIVDRFNWAVQAVDQNSRNLSVEEMAPFVVEMMRQDEIAARIK